MGLNTQQYVRKPNPIEVVEVTKDNVSEVAIWCGGRTNHIKNVMSDTLIPMTIGVPSLYGAIDAEVGQFIARESETGKFVVLSREHLEAEYSQVGQRQDGLFGQNTNTWNGQR